MARLPYGSRGDAFRFYGRAEVSARVGSDVGEFGANSRREMQMYWFMGRVKATDARDPPLVKHRVPRSPRVSVMFYRRTPVSSGVNYKSVVVG
jgi:hypothetical protein